MLRIGLIVPPGFAVLSFAPLSVFETANMVLESPFYEVHAVSMTGGRIPNSFGMEMETVRVTDGTFDTLLIGSPPDVRPQSPELLSFFAERAQHDPPHCINLHWRLYPRRSRLARRPQGNDALVLCQ
jgi:transcriptional regulator GlxA family with amidase domain